MASKPGLSLISMCAQRGGDLQNNIWFSWAMPCIGYNQRFKISWRVLKHRNIAENMENIGKNLKTKTYNIDLLKINGDMGDVM